MAELYLIVRLAGHRIALPARDVEGVAEIDPPVPVPQAPPHIAGLTALRSRVLTVVDCLASLKPGARLAPDTSEAVVAALDGHGYALLVEGVEDVVEASETDAAQRSGFTGGWQRVGRTTVDAAGDLLLLADVAALVAGPPQLGRGTAGLSPRLPIEAIEGR